MEFRPRKINTSNMTAAALFHAPGRLDGTQLKVYAYAQGPLAWVGFAKNICLRLYSYSARVERSPLPFTVRQIEVDLNDGSCNATHTFEDKPITVREAKECGSNGYLDTSHLPKAAQPPRSPNEDITTHRHVRLDGISESHNREIIEYIFGPAYINTKIYFDDEDGMMTPSGPEKSKRFALFNVTRETDRHVEGELLFNARRGMLKCNKIITDDFTTVRCPVSQDRFGLKPFRKYLGLMSVRDELEVEMTVPNRLIHELEERPTSSLK